MNKFILITVGFNSVFYGITMLAKHWNSLDGWIPLIVDSIFGVLVIVWTVMNKRINWFNF